MTVVAALEIGRSCCLPNSCERSPEREALIIMQMERLNPSVNPATSNATLMLFPYRSKCARSLVTRRNLQIMPGTFLLLVDLVKLEQRDFSEIPRFIGISSLLYSMVIYANVYFDGNRLIEI